MVSFQGWVQAQHCAATLPVGETRGSKGKGGRDGGGSPGLHKRMFGMGDVGKWSARKVGETGPGGPGTAGTSPLPARGRSP